MSSTPSISTDAAKRRTLIHRETIQLAALIGIAVAAFFITKAVAANNRDLSLRNAAEWYRRGQQSVTSGRIDDAIDAFRRATVRNRTNRTYVLALARTLTLKGDFDSARSILLTLRESAPEDAELNRDLGRLAAARQDVPDVLRFYHDALYAPWPVDQAETRRTVRLELIRFLLTHNEAGRAQSELLAASADLPDDAPHHVELAQLFARAGDARNALVHFQRALRVAPDNSDASAGAGTAAFHLGQYSLAQRYLRQVPSQIEDAQDMRAIVDLLVARDPTAARIGSRERRRRLDADVSYVQQRLADCLARLERKPASVDEPTLVDELQTFERQLRRPAALDQDTIETGVDLIGRVEQEVLKHCGSPTPVDQALVLIARQHAVDSR
jgi:thioredoxin-like negative regulator of GroEL